MWLSFIRRKGFSRFLYLTKKDFKKGLMEPDRVEFKYFLENAPEARQYLDISKRLDRDMKREGKKTIPLFDQAEEIMHRCGIKIPSEN